MHTINKTKKGKTNVSSNCIIEGQPVYKDTIHGNPGVHSVARYSLPEKYPWERSLLELVPEVKITLVCDWSTWDGRPISIKYILV